MTIRIHHFVEFCWGGESGWLHETDKWMMLKRRAKTDDCARLTPRLNHNEPSMMTAHSYSIKLTQSSILDIYQSAGPVSFAFQQG
jgi:hypothetical protein